jgi:hypothetical protein
MGQTLCMATPGPFGPCVDLTGDPKNCGACGITCPPQSMCVERMCTTPPPPPSSCPTVILAFDWGTHGMGPCSVILEDMGGFSVWHYTNTSDKFVGGVFAECRTGQWVISQEKCAARGPSTECFPPGTRCDGSGPAIFPYEHCGTCCNASNLDGPACL